MWPLAVLMETCMINEVAVLTRWPLRRNSTVLYNVLVSVGKCLRSNYNRVPDCNGN